MFFPRTLARLPRKVTPPSTHQHEDEQPVKFFAEGFERGGHLGFYGFDRDAKLVGDLRVGHSSDFAFDKYVAASAGELLNGVENDFTTFGVNEFEFGEWVLNDSDEKHISKSKLYIFFVLSVFPELGYAVVVDRFVQVRFKGFGYFQLFADVPDVAEC